MGLYSKQVSTGRILEWQSGGNEATLEMNAGVLGIVASDLEYVIADQMEWQLALSDDPTRAVEKAIQQEEQLIADRCCQVAEDRDRKEAVRLLKLEGNAFDHFDKNGKRV